MRLRDRLHYFFRNLSAWVLMLIFWPIYSLWNMIVTTKVLFITDGSEEIIFPNEYDWLGLLDKEED